MLDYDMPLYRPPSEGDNLIIQATLGCSFNQCSFCSMYKSKEYNARPLEAVFADIEQAATLWPDAHRVFLADGDALTLPAETLIQILEKLNEELPHLARISCYATPINILRKSPEELAEFKARKLNLLYLGIESGADRILKKITKGASQRGIRESMEKASAAQLKVSATVILGLGGSALWEEHIDGTTELLNSAPVTYLSTLQLYLEQGAINEFFDKFGEPFQVQDDLAILREQERLISGIEPPLPLIFRSNHASNALALAGNLPRDRERLLATIRKALDNHAGIRPRYLRGL